VSSLLSSLWNTLSQRWTVAKESIVSSFRSGLMHIFSSTPKWDLEREWELKKILLGADLGPTLTQKLLTLLKEKSLNDPGANLQILYDELLSYFPAKTNLPVTQDVYVLVGVNGAGKTTTAAKLTYMHRNKNPLLIAADTYRAAAIEQLQQWADRMDAACYASTLSDPSAVAYQGLDYAAIHQHSPIMIDTSGRLQTHKNLMQELVKIKKTILKKVDPERVRMILVLDGAQGQNMLQQVEVFHAELQLSAIIVTKLDGSSRAGALCQIAEKYAIPIDYIGVGEKAEQLIPFDRELFLKALLGIEP